MRRCLLYTSDAADDKAIALTKTQFEVLELLVTHPKSVVLRDQFNSCIWEHRGVFVDQNTLTVHISNLKKAIHEDGSYIETVHNIGYRWLREVEVCKREPVGNDR